MAEKRSSRPRGRLFVALELPERMREAVSAWQGAELRDPSLRATREEGLHITLVFLGWHPEADFDRVCEAALGGGPAQAPRVQLRREPVPLPPVRPRLFAIEAESPGTIALQERVESRLVEAGLHQPEERPFWPHLTVARVRPEKAGSRRPARLARPPGQLPEECEHPFDAVRLQVYRSFLRPTGAEYVPISKLDLNH